MIHAGTPVLREDGTQGITTAPTRRNTSTISVMWQGGQYPVLEQEEDLTPVPEPVQLEGTQPMDPEVRHYLLVEVCATGKGAMVIAELDDEDYAMAASEALNADPVQPGRRYFYTEKP